jgi:hypothetical protein
MWNMVGMYYVMMVLKNLCFIFSSLVILDSLVEDWGGMERWPGTYWHDIRGKHMSLYQILKEALISGSCNEIIFERERRDMEQCYYFFK